MNRKWIGAVLVFIACGGFGFSMASAYKSEVRMYKSLISVLTIMKAELQFRLTTLPELCQYAATEANGTLRKIFSKLSYELQTWTFPDVSNCMRKVLNEETQISLSLRKNLLTLGDILGRFDLDGQVQGLDMIKKECECALKTLYDNREERIRGYQTLGLCTGAALVILFI